MRTRYCREIQKLLLEGKNVEAEALVNANFTCKGPGSGGAQYGCYQVLGNLHLYVCRRRYQCDSYGLSATIESG